jgi:ABC-type transport system substrate-binding protein
VPDDIDFETKPEIALQQVRWAWEVGLPRGAVLPGKPLAPSLAESWTVSPDALIYEFLLREDAKFHNGEAVTAEDVKFSFERYRGTGRPRHPFTTGQGQTVLAAAGHPNGFDAGECYCDATYANLAEAVLNNPQAVGIHAKLRPPERAAFFKEYSEKKLKNIIQGGSGAFGWSDCWTRLFRTVRGRQPEG